MNWYSLALAGLSGGIAALVGMLVYGKGDEDTSSRRTLIVVVFLVLTVLSKVFVLPKINAWQAKADVQKAMTTVPVFASLEKHAPDTHRRIAKTLNSAIERGEPSNRVILIARGEIQRFVEARLPHASDEAIVRYVRIMGVEMGELQARGKDLCYQFLFPQGTAGLDMMTLISKETQAKDLAALDEVIKSSGSMRPPLPEKDVMPLLQPVLVELYKKHGESMSYLDNPTAPGVDKDKLCSITRDLYQNITAQPMDRAAPILRWMLAQK